MIARFTIGSLTKVAVLAFTMASLVVSPAFAQIREAQNQQGQTQTTPSPAQTQQAASQQGQGQIQPPTPGQTAPQASQLPSPPVNDPARDLSATKGRDYSKGQPWFPEFWKPYTPISMPEPLLTNAPSIDQLIHDGKLMLSLDDAISIALENNLDISLQRFTPYIAQTELLRANAGSVAHGLGASQTVILGSSPQTAFDPLLTINTDWGRSSIPINNPLSSGVGVADTPFNLIDYNAYANFTYQQGFHTGTAISVAFDNLRSSTNSPGNIFNPAVQSTMIFSIQQPLLNGFGILPNTRYIIEAKNTLKVAASQFAQQVIATVSAVQTDYWELVFARENVKVEEAAVAVSNKLYGDNKKQLEIGTMAPLDVLTAESELATDTQNLIVAQTNMLQQETVLLNAITRDPLAPSLRNIEVVPTTGIGSPNITENLPLMDAVNEAWQKRPEIFQADLNLKNAEVEVKATRNSLLPTLNLVGQYSATGLAGNEVVTNATQTGFQADPNSPIVGANNLPFNVGNPGAPGVPAFVGIPVFNTTTNLQKSGLNTALDQMIHSNFPTYSAGLNLIVPIRNRSAQADSARAQIDKRQQELQYRQLQNTIFVNVRNAQIALQQDRAQVAAAEKARILAQQTLDAEQKKYQLGSSTSYQVVLRSRDLTTAQGNELRAKINLIEAAVNFDQAVGRTLDVNHIIVADASRGKVYRQPNIPGAPDANNGIPGK
ncbi:MAG TPA: TolC family protein [Terriglobales bacterium]|nr:TolC family protein [Terriglobales bacterium]